MIVNTDMIDIRLNEYDNRLLGMYMSICNGAFIECRGYTWVVKTTERDIEFKTYKSFIGFVEGEVKEILLQYAFNNELGELAEL